MDIFEEINTGIKNLLKEKGFEVNDMRGATVSKKDNTELKEYRAVRKDRKFHIRFQEIK